MAIIFQLVSILSIAALTASQSPLKPTKYDSENVQPQPSLLAILQPPQPSLSSNLELPREEPADVPFYSPESLDLEFLRAPSADYYENPVNTYNSEYPIPSQELQVPSAEPWNPNNDPKYYYELPPILTKQEVPTNAHPKKFNKDLYEKQKPLSSKPKLEFTLNPISEQEYQNKQKGEEKLLLNLAKVQNQKQLQNDKVHNTFQEPQTAASEFAQGFQSEGIQGFGSAEAHHAPPAPHNRQEFQMHGFDGPYSYKWGYDTGKGHNRQFRYEERDKHGHVKGHYGYHDKHGKLRMVHYNAHPHEGFHAEGNFELPWKSVDDNVIYPNSNSLILVQIVNYYSNT